MICLCVKVLAYLSTLRLADLRIRMDPESVTGKDLHVQGLTERHVAELKDYLKVLEIGAKHRTVAETNMNEVSSRSHAVFTLTIEQTQWRESDQSIASRKRSKIHFIDLAGSERADATGAVGARLKEGSMINQSLLSLGNVISALSKRPSTKDDQGHQKYIPYRDSKLTYLLSDSLGGNSLTLMVACVTPTGACYDESISTLRFAERAKKVTNNARVNLDATSLKILELEGEIHRLKTLLSKCSCGIAEESGSSLMMKITKWIPVSSLRVCLGLESSEVVTKTTLTTVEQEDDDQAEPSTPRSPVPIWRQKPRMPRLESLRNFKRILPAVPPAAA